MSAVSIWIYWLTRNFEISSPDLVIPHPRAHERRFVLDPLIELLGEDYCSRDVHPSVASGAVRGANDSRIVDFLAMITAGEIELPEQSTTSGISLRGETVPGHRSGGTYWRG